MKAAILVESSSPLEVDDVKLPDKLAYGQVKVKILYSGICGAQINEIDAVKGPDKFLPHLLGHEASGEVLDIGEGVSTVNQGDNVVLHWRPSSGIQSATPKYNWNGTEVNAGWVTTFNEEAIISENRLTAIPKEFDMRLAPLFGCAVTTAFGVVNNDAQIKIGQSLIVFGLGGVGLNIVQAASMVSAHPIIGIDIQKNKIEMAKKYGLTYGIVGNPSEIKKEVIKLIGEKGSEGGSCIPDIDIPRYIDLMKSNKMTLDGLITHEFCLDEINGALQLFRSGNAGRILINMQSN